MKDRSDDPSHQEQLDFNAINHNSRIRVRPRWTVLRVYAAVATVLTRWTTDLVTHRLVTPVMKDRSDDPSHQLDFNTINHNSRIRVRPRWTVLRDDAAVAAVLTRWTRDLVAHRLVLAVVAGVTDEAE